MDCYFYNVIPSPSKMAWKILQMGIQVDAIVAIADNVLFRLLM